MLEMLWSSPSRAEMARKKKAKATQAAFEAFRAAHDDIPFEDDLPFLRASARQIVQHIDQMEPAATRVLEAYIRQTIRKHKDLNAITECNFDQALAQARELDESFARTGQLSGPVHGVPISVKDQLNITGLDSSIGFSNRVDKPAEKDAVLITLLKQAGAVPFVKTNVPQTLLSFESSNPVFGRTANPHDPQRTSGGSSSGEAALLGSDCTPLGLGTDIGGSLRIPAHYSGCFSLKTCFGRLPDKGLSGPSRGFESVLSSAGPMGRCVDDLIFLSKALFDGATEPILRASQPKFLLPEPFKEVQLPARLKFGFYLNDNLFTTSPACQRAVKETVAALRKAGHECIELDPPDAVECMRIFVALSSADGYEGLLSNLDGDPAEPSLFLITLQKKLGPTLMRWISKTAPGDAKLFSITEQAGEKRVIDVRRWQARRDDFVAKVRGQLWGDMQLDGIIAPVQAVPAIKHGQAWNLQFLAAGTILWNVVESAVGVLPVTKVDKAKDRLTTDWGEAHTDSSPNLDKLLYGRDKLSGNVYDVESMHGLPCGVQVVGPLYSEEKVLQMMKVIDDALGERGFGPGSQAGR